MTTALIDGDLIAYRCAAVNENADLGLACWQADQLISRILDDVNADNWTIFLSGENNFRYAIWSEYKANRRDMVKPRHLEGLREYLVLAHGARVADGVEADDEMGIFCTSLLASDGGIICSLDKDLLQVPGRHYNFVRREIVVVDDWTGLLNFFGQLLTGDQADNIRGCPGIGKVKAPKILEGCATERDLVEACWLAFERAGCTEEEFIRDAKLLYILREDGDSWRPPLDLVVEC